MTGYIDVHDEDRAPAADTGAAMGFCPTSDLFPGSGLLDLHAARADLGPVTGHSCWSLHARA